MPKDPVEREKTRKKMSESHRGKHHSEETRGSIANAKCGTHPSDETRKSISNALCGRKFSDSHRKSLSESLSGNRNPNYGKKFSESTCKKLSESHLGKSHSIETRRKLSEINSGEKSILWKGGISFEPYCQKFNREFKDRVRAFFGQKCIECGMTREENNQALDVHHVNYDKMTCCNDVKPLFVALCRPHNSMANYNREYWEEHYTTIINEKYGGRCYLPII